MARGRRLESTYYVENFETLLETVLSRYGDLLRDEELAFAAELRALPRPARCLYVRLVSRKGPVFRRDRLRYAEIPHLDRAIRRLTEARFLDRAPDGSSEDLLRLLRRHEILELARAVLEPESASSLARRSRGELVDAVLAGATQVQIEGWARAHIEVLRPLRLDMVDCFRLLFFGNLRQDWREIVLSDLGVWTYEDYELSAERRAFPDRPSLDDALGARRLRDLARSLLSRGEAPAAAALLRDAVARRPPWRPAARAVLDSVLVEVGQALERLGALEPALDLYRAARRPPARERLARGLVKLGSERRALAVCRRIERNPRDESERLFASRFAHRIRRRLGQVPPVYRRRPRERRLRLDARAASSSGSCVERLVVAELARRGRTALYSENRLWMALFGLAFWDVVFAPVPGAFEHRFQSGPLDLWEPEFRRRRRAAIARRLAEIEDGGWPSDRILALWDAKRGVRNGLVSWSSDLRPALALVLGRVSGRHLALVCDRLSRDLRRYRRGFPDLFVCREREPGFELLEVKSPGDRLRPEQRSWLDFFAGAGIPSSVLAVEWS